MVALINTDAEWQSFVAAAQQVDAPYVFMYSAAWCGPCKRIIPLFQALAEQWSNSVRFAKVDVDGAHESAQQQQVDSMPTFIAHYRDGTTERCLGANEEQLQTLVARVTDAAVVRQEQQPQQQEDSAPPSAQTQDEQESVVLVHEIAHDADWDDFVRFVQSKRLPVVLEFGTESDATCQRMRKVFFEAAQMYSGKCIFARVNSASASVVNQTFNTSGSIPYYCAYDAGGNGRGQFVGAQQSRFIGLVHNAVDQ